MVTDKEASVLAIIGLIILIAGCFLFSYEYFNLLLNGGTLLDIPICCLAAVIPTLGIALMMPWIIRKFGRQ